MDASDEEFAKMEQGIRDMAKELPATAVEIAAVAEAAGQLGIQNENILSFTRTMIDLGEATNMTADQAATSFAQFANITQMPQSEFDKLGSTVVALGNNLATTEGDIVSLGMRLAGTGSQVGLTQAEIMGLAAAMSSVGVNAEAGGSAFSRVMQKINSEVLSSGDNLQGFAEVAGMSAEQFASLWQEKPTAAIEAFVAGLGLITEAGGDVTSTLKDLGINSVQEIDTLLRLSGAGELLASSFDLANGAWEENIALTKEAEQRYATTKSGLAILKNNFMDIGITLGEILIPMLTQFSSKLMELTNSFAQLNPGTQEMIVKIGLFAAAIGPVIMAIGMLVTGLGGITSAAGGVISFFAAGGAGATALGAAATALGVSVGGLVAIIAGVGIAFGLLNKDMKKSSIQTDIYGEEVSESTKKAVDAFLSLEKEASTSLQQLNSSGQAVTQELANGISTQFGVMKNEVVSNLEAQKEESLNTLREMYSEMGTMTDEEIQKKLDQVASSYDNEIAKHTEGSARVSEILAQASEAKRTLTEAERLEIDTIRTQMKDDGIRILSESEAEYAVIQQRMKDQAVALSAEQSAEVVQNSIKQRDETILAAEEEYNQRIKLAEQLKLDGTTESKAMADEIIAEAKRQKDESVNTANAMHDEILADAKEFSGEYVDNVDWTTGEVKTKWQVLRDDVVAKAQDISAQVSQWWDKVSKDTQKLGQDINNWWQDTVSKTKTAWDNIKQHVSDNVKNIETSISNGFNEIKEAISKSWENVKTRTSDTWNTVKSTITNAINAARDAVNNAINRIKSILSVTLPFPKIKLPHFRISGSFSLNPPSVPSFGVDWYDKGGIFSSPTVIGVNFISPAVMKIAA